jgi:uncharacterized protein with FMN-binding domain
MRRIVLWFLSTLTVVVLLFGYHTSTSGTLTAGSDVVVPAPATPGAATTPSTGATGGTSSTGSSGSTEKKTVTGPLVQTRWGPVQVKVTASGGKLTDVTVVQYPYSNPKDQEINDYAIPVLVQEAIDAQSADIDMVSGATVTSVGYQSSLQSALDEVGL